MLKELSGVNKKSNILIITCVFPPEPVVSATLSFDIATELSKFHNVTVISPIPSRPNGMRFNETENIHYPFFYKRLKSYVSRKSTLISRLKESHSFGLQSRKFIEDNHKNIDLIYMNTWPILAQVYTVLVAKKYSIPIITHIQDIYPESLTQKLPFGGKILNRFLLPIDKLIAYNSRSLITISDGMKDLLVTTRNVSSSKISVIYNWQNEARFSVNIEDFPTKKECFIYMFVGSINTLANIESIIIAFMKANLNKSKLIIAGEGSEKQNLISFVERNKIQNVKFLSFDSKDIGLVQSKSDVLVLGLKKGASGLAFPSKIPAYMFSSRPILAYVDVPSDVAKTIQIANCGWVVPSGNINELTKRFIEIHKIENEDLKVLGGNGNKYAIEYLSRSTNLKKIISVIEARLD